MKARIFFFLLMYSFAIYNLTWKSAIHILEKASPTVVQSAGFSLSISSAYPS